MPVCTTLLPAASADVCSPNVKFGRIDHLLFTRKGDSLTSAADPAEWVTRVENSLALPDNTNLAPIRYLFGIGELPLPSFTAIEVSLGRKIDTDFTHTLTFQVEDLSTVNATLLNTLQGKTSTYSVWFVVDDEVFGGNTGITATLSFQGRVIPGAKAEAQTMTVVCEFKTAMPVPIPWLGEAAVGTN